MLFTSLALALALAGQPAQQYTYTGTLSPVKDDGERAVKEFTLVACAAGEEGAEYVWTLAESGRGGWTWLDHFGRAGSQQFKPGGTGPTLLYERAEGKSAVPLPCPQFQSPVALASGVTWSEGRLECRVTGAAKKAGRDCWEVEMRSPYGHKRTLWVAQDGPLLVALRETVFMGQGVEHTLRMDLAEAKPLTADEAAAIVEAERAWSALRTEIGWQVASPLTQASAEQLAALKTRLPKLAESAAAGPFATIAAAAQGQTKDQKNVASAVAALRDGALGQSLAELALTDISGKPLKLAELKDKVIVLHFWEYRDAPLEEPYGQTGYLDFLIRRRPGAAVIGVHVDPKLADAETRGGSLAAAKRLKAFMNLSYPICQDSGELIKRVGDPRVAGGKLPLFVVIGKDGKIADYHAGHYDVKPNDGLVELDALVQQLLAK